MYKFIFILYSFSITHWLGKKVWNSNLLYIPFIQIYTIYTTILESKHINNFVLNLMGFSVPLFLKLVTKVGNGDGEWTADNNWPRYKTCTKTLGFEQHTISFMLAAPLILRRYLLCAYNVIYNTVQNKMKQQRRLHVCWQWFQTKDNPNLSLFKKEYPILLKRNQTNQFGHLFKTKIQKPQFVFMYIRYQIFVIVYEKHRNWCNSLMKYT